MPQSEQSNCSGRQPLLSYQKVIDALNDEERESNTMLQEEATAVTTQHIRSEIDLEARESRRDAAGRYRRDPDLGLGDFRRGRDLDIAEVRA